MANKMTQEIVVDVGPKGVFLAGFGMGGRIDRSQGRPKRFKDILAAVDRVLLWARIFREGGRRFFSDRQREVKVIFTGAFWAALEAESRRLKSMREAQP